MDRYLGLRTVIYVVDDLAAAKKWYSEVFGLAAYFDEPFYVGFNVAGYELGLMPSENNDLKIGDNVLVYWGVENVENTYEQMIGLGARAHQTPENVGGQIVVASLKDPWGNLIGIIYNPDFNPDQQTNPSTH